MIHNDWLFKELLTEFFVEFLELFCPQLAESLDKAALEFVDKQVFSDIPGAELSEPDLVAKVRLLGQEAFCLIHSEIQGQRQKDFNRRMFWYFAVLDRKFGLPVYPIALFSHSVQVNEPDSYSVAFPDLNVLNFQYRSIQLNKLNWRDFVRQRNPVACALMAKMGMSPAERPRVKLECLRLLATLKLNPAKARFVSGFIDTYLQLTAQETLLFKQEADRVLKKEEKREVMELTTSWKEEGIAEGIMVGEAKGRINESQRLVTRLLQRRFGLLPDSAKSRLQILSLDQLENLAEALLDFKTAEDLEIWLAKS